MLGQHTVCVFKIDRKEAAICTGSAGHAARGDATTTATAATSAALVTCGVRTALQSDGQLGSAQSYHHDILFSSTIFMLVLLAPQLDNKPHTKWRTDGNARFWLLFSIRCNPAASRNRAAMSFLCLIG